MAVGSAPIYIEQHPRPSQAAQVQAAQMPRVSVQSAGEMVWDGRLPLNSLVIAAIPRPRRAESMYRYGAC
jgi:hypothetical protein